MVLKYNKVAAQWLKTLPISSQSPLAIPVCTYVLSIITFRLCMYTVFFFFGGAGGKVVKKYLVMEGD
ncbi:hypothetical protein C0W40_13770 [Photobacterium leiognathi subsp. mandapamensis]|nr:hypothetical protein C0W40_13770 [Photobacterium leiognathi subsp. mandapamensis]